MKTQIHLLGLAMLATICGADLQGMPSNSFRAVAAGNGNWVAVDRDGRLLTSTNSVDWAFQKTGTVFALYAIAFGNGTFVAVGNEGAVLTSRNGIDWTPQNPNTDERLRGVAFGNGRFIVVGYEGTILTSKDGLRWIKCFSGTSERLQSVAFGNGRFVTVGWGGEILTSGKGVVWSKRPVSPCKLMSITFENENFIALDDHQHRLISIDGASWANRLRTTARR